MKRDNYYTLSFRGWEPDLKQYYYFDLYDVYCAGNHVFIHPDVNRPMTCFNINHRPFEEYTETEDIDNKKIYRKDIVKLTRSLSYQSKKGDIATVEFNPVELGYTLISKEGNYSISKLTPARSKYLKVIGNEHEGINE